MGKLSGKTILLTGATKGIGRALALRLARENARLALCGRDVEALDLAAKTIAGRGGVIPLTRAFDLRDESAVLGFYRHVRAQWGAVDILINNAGYNERKAPLTEVTTEEFDAVLAVNLRAPFLLMREAGRDMKERGGGRIVNVLSTVCHFANESMGVYTAAKSGLKALTEVFRKEVRPFGVRVSSVYPGGTDTSFRAGARPDYLRPESVAEAIFALLTLPEDLVVHDLTFRPMVETNF